MCIRDWFSVIVRQLNAAQDWVLSEAGQEAFAKEYENVTVLSSAVLLVEAIAFLTKQP